MPGSSEQERAWIKRVLGIEIAESGVEPDDVLELLDLKNRLAEATRELVKLKAEGDPALPQLIAAHDAALAAYQTKTPEAGPLMDALESVLARALSDMRSREALAVGAGKVEYAKLLLRWRAALGKVQGNLKALGAAVLAEPDVRDDEYYDEIEDAVAELPELIPDFGGVLDGLLNDLGKPGADAVRLHLEALDTLAEYREELADIPELKELEPFAAEHGLGEFLLFSEFDTALQDVEDALRKAG